MGKAKQNVFETTFSTYHQESLVGSGGAGVVVKVTDENDNIYAIKYLSPNNLSSDKVRRFKNELSFCSTNEHKNIVKVVDWGWVAIDSHKCPFYVMPYFERTLRRLLEAGISPSNTLPYFSQILNGVEAAHLQGVCHRDLKPENILFDAATNTLVVADFGIARFAEPLLQTAVQTKDNQRLANFQYAAPEQRQRGSQVDHRADIYALGLMLNEMFTGKVAQGVDFMRIGEASMEYSYLDEIVHQMLKQDPGQRPNSIDEIKRLLIGRKNEFIEQQKLSKLKGKVIPKTEVDDPLIENPPEIVDVEWKGGHLIFTLSQPVNREWAQWFANPDDHGYILGYGPTNFGIDDMSIAVKCDGNMAQKLIPFAKEYVAKANNRYKLQLVRAAQERVAKEEAELKRQIVEAEKAKRINDALKL